MKIVLVFALSAALFLSCSKSRLPSGILKPEKMQAVFWDFIRADVYANEILRRDPAKNVTLENARLQEQVFQLHKVSKEDFYRSYEYYLKHQQLMKSMVDTMLVRQQKHYEVKIDTVPKPIEDKISTLR
jgi:hypothetical protein